MLSRRRLVLLRVVVLLACLGWSPRQWWLCQAGKAPSVSGTNTSPVPSSSSSSSSPRETTTTKTTTTKQILRPLQVFAKTVRDAKRHLAAAAVGRASSIFLMYPVDTIKTRMQMGQADPLRLTGIFKGITGSLVGQVPYGVLTFGSYEIYKNALLERFPNIQPLWIYATSAVLGDLTGSGWLCPSEVVKQQMQAGMYSTTTQALQSIWSKKGIVGLYEGYFGGITRDVPFRVAQLTTFELAKSAALRLKAMRQERKKATCQAEKEDDNATTTALELTAFESAICGAISGTFSAAITSPLDRIKTLLMTDSQAYGGTVFSCVTKIWKTEGLAGFATGMIPRVAYIAPSAVIFFVAYEATQQHFKSRNPTTTLNK